MMRIKALSDALANQIAAGEVIDRPSSVVKELLENALDAKATLIELEIEYGGLNLIKIQDNGCGIDKDDLPLAITAHATSKIQNLSDLFAINSLGFRGEALASIASVSRFSIQSKPEYQNQAYTLTENIDDNARFYACARQTGTTIEVRDLFFNTPVRKSFLRPVKSEYLHIERVIKCFALSCMQVGLRFKHNNQLILNLPAALNEKLVLARIQKIMGKQFLNHSSKVNCEHEGMILKGWVGGAQLLRSQNDKQWVYLNQRMIKDKLILHAIKKAYEPILFEGRYPSCVLFLQIPYQELDVNVHPTKHEVRFIKSRMVHDFILSSVKRNLEVYEGGDAITYSNKTSYPNSQGQAVTRLNDSKLISTHSLYPQSENMQALSWHTLNHRFIILSHEACSYLVDAQQLIQAQLKEHIQKTPLPWQARPLLLPFQKSINKHGLNDHDIHLLAQAAIQLDFLTDTTIALRSIPCDFHQLDIENFLEDIFTCGDITHDKIVQKLLKHTVNDMRFIDKDTKHLMIEFFIEHFESWSNNQTIYMSLTPEKCADMFARFV